MDSIRKIMYDIEERDVSMSMEDPLYYLSVELTKAKQLIEDIRTKLMGKGIICWAYGVLCWDECTGGLR